MLVLAGHVWDFGVAEPVDSVLILKGMSDTKRAPLKAAASIAALLLVVALGACDESGAPAPANDPGGVGMTYSGKIGIDLGGGLVMPYDGSSVGLGYGF